MAAEKFVKMLQALKKGTDEKRISWEDLPEEEMFRTHVSGGMVRIGETGLASTTRRGYTLWLLGPGGAIAAEVRFFPGDPGYDIIEDLYQSARLVARNGDWMVENIIRTLNPTGTP